MNLPDASDTPAGDAASSPGRIIVSRYRVEKILGRGGMGEVLLAHDTLLNRRVALKRLRSNGAEGTSRRSAILKEARRASQINDRRIASIYDVLDLEDEVLIVMEYVDGFTLRQRMARPIPIEDFWDLSMQCVEAVGAALTCWQLNEKGRAIAWLEKAVRGGYPVAWLRDSPVFQQWRDEQGFRALIADAGPVSEAASNKERGRR